MLLDFNDDIIDYICNFLTAKEIFKLSISCKGLYDHLHNNNSIYKLIYFKVFPDLNSPMVNESLVNNWCNYFKFKTDKANKLFTWGATDLGRLGYLINQVPQEKLTVNKNVCIPNNVANFNPTIIWNVVSTGFSFIVLTNKGVYFTGNDYKKYHDLSAPGPPQLDFKHRINLTAPIGIFPRITYPGLPAPPRRSTTTNLEGNNSSINAGGSSTQPDPNRRTNPNLTRPPDQIPELREFQSQVSSASKDPPKEVSDPEPVIESNFVTKLKLPKEGGTITTISSGRQHFVALDDKNQLFTWDTGNSSLVGVKLLFPQPYEHLHDSGNPIRMIKCGWNLSSCYVDRKLVIWYLREPLIQEQIDSDRYESVVKCFVLPIDNLVDYHLGNDFLIVLKEEGCFGFNLHTLDYFNNHQNYPSVIDLSFNDFILLQGFNDHLNRLNEPGYNFRFFKVTGCFDNFAIFINNNHDILFGNKSMINEESHEIVPNTFDLPENIIDLQMGDYHCLALTADGDVYSWGLQSNNCGCLGLGVLKETSNNPNIIEDRNSLRVKVPTKIESPTGKWAAITASGWHSAGICLEEC